MKKMKTFATTLLLIAFLGAALSWPYHSSFWGGLALAACEAALVGALADWFAIVALFRHPLGLRFIPHTAIIPNNRKRIIDSIVYMVENQWLKIEIIREKIKNYEVMDKVHDILQTEEGKERLRLLISSIISNTAKNIEADSIAEFIQKLIKDKFPEIRISPEIVQKVEKSLKELYSDDAIDLFVDGAKGIINTEDFLNVTKNTLRKAADDYTKSGFLRRLGKGIGEGLALINYGEAARSIVDKLEEVIEGLKTNGNPYRTRLKDGIMDFKIADRESFSIFLGKWVQNIIHTSDGHKILVDLVNALKERFFSEDIRNSLIVSYLTEMSVAQINKMNSDETKKAHFEGWIKEEVLSLVEKYHSVIGKLVEDNLQALNDESFAGSLEDRVGEDLQWIRVNGTVIGALVGIVQYLILYLL